ncbi:MAG: hypothetical protein HF560_11035 [Synechococcus sp. MIT S9220]|uniref:hypothetical protein n=1 Tax=unclassified Synechococcus TaxID=2626047 RepID=UPI00164C550F|nr:hypothetical protein [Synechococcus sp. MIT S9220]NOL48092.1 hypothetical protein [Synechococcus sp. MIT S9220]
MPFLYLLSYGIVLAFGQVLFKISSNQVDNIDLFSLASISKMVTQPYFILACFVYGLSTLAWVGILARVNLAIAYPFVISTSILATSLIGVFAFGEEVNSYTFVSYGLIICALATLSKGIIGNV